MTPFVNGSIKMKKLTIKNDTNPTLSILRTPLRDVNEPNKKPTKPANILSFVPPPNPRKPIAVTLEAVACKPKGVASITLQTMYSIWLKMKTKTE